MKKSTMIVCVTVGILLMIVGASLLSSGSDDSAPWDADDWDTETVGSYEMAEVTAVEVATQGMNVRLYDGWENTIQVDVSSHALDRVDCALSGGVLTVDEVETGRGGEIDLWLPKGCVGALSVSTVSGEIDVSSVRGDSVDYTLTTSSGMLNLYESRLRSLTASTASGDIYISDAEVYGSMAVAAASGYVNVYGLEGRDGKITAESGDVDIYDAQIGSLTVGTAGGDVYLEDSDIPALTVGTVSGDVDLSLPGTPEDYTVTISTDTGHVDGVRSRTGGTRTLSVTTSSGDVEASFYDDGYYGDEGYPTEGGEYDDGHDDDYDDYDVYDESDDSAVTAVMTIRAAR